MASANGRHCPSGTTCSQAPMRSASSAGTLRPVRMISIARPMPTMRGKRTGPPSMSGAPPRGRETPKYAASSITRPSPHSASSNPPATAGPATAAITGLSSSSRVGPSGPRGMALRSSSGWSMSWSCFASSIIVAQYLRSQPAQKAPPSPHSTATAAFASLLNASKAPPSASALSGSIALRDSAREWMTVHTFPFFSILTAMRASIDWYFDFVSPYSYIALHRLRELPHAVNYKPVLFAGLLNHWGQKGPAEIPAKRRWTYRWCTWWAGSLGIPFRFPAEHPFNPLQHLRLALACGSRPEAVKRIFEAIWVRGGNASDAARFAALCTELKINEGQLTDEG